MTTAHPRGHTTPRNGAGRLTRLAAAATAATATTAAAGLALAAQFTQAPAAHALPTPAAPTDPTTQALWANPDVRPRDAAAKVQVKLTSLSATTVNPGEKVEVTGEIHNTSTQRLSQAQVRLQRAPAVDSVAASRQALAAPQGAYSIATAFSELDTTIEPGASATFTLTLDTTELGMEQGFYPLLINLNGQLGSDPVAYLDSDRFLFAVGQPTAAADAEPTPAPTTLLWPLSATVDVVGGETGTAPEAPPLIVESEQLSKQLAPEGRLGRLLDAYNNKLTGPDGEALRRGSCLALDPQLINVVARMAEGYTVAATRPVPVLEPKRLRDSWGQSSSADVAGLKGSHAGQGQDVAAAWLEKLRTVAQQSCTVALPWANADLAAVGRTGSTALMREALSRGPLTLTEVLGVVPEGNIVLPGGGYITPAIAGAMSYAGSTPPAPGGDESPEGAPPAAKTAAPIAAMSAAWEADQHTAPAQSDAEEGSGSLNNPSLPAPGAALPGTQTAQPVSVLVADNTTWGAPRSGAFATLAPGVTAVRYQGSLAATLASVGEDPRTAAYSNEEGRYDYRMDSRAARAQTAAAAVALDVAQAATGMATSDAGEPSAASGLAPSESRVIVTLPAAVDTDAITAVLDPVLAQFSRGVATPLPLREAITPSAAETQRLEEATAQAGFPGGNPAAAAQPVFGTPFADPAEITDTEILRARQQASYIGDLTRLMTNDPQIALTRFGFTEPLLDDLLRAVSINGRRAASTYVASTDLGDRILTANRDTLLRLRASVALLPPGNVYTRASNSSPLLIVARNGLPLPVDAALHYSGVPAGSIHVPTEQRIPARGSITVQMTADLPLDAPRASMVLWLATRAGQAVSDPVEVSVQNRGELIGRRTLMVLAAVAVALIVAGRTLKRRGKRRAAAKKRG